jgi:hypothetical protein
MKKECLIEAAIFTVLSTVVLSFLFLTLVGIIMFSFYLFESPFPGLLFIASALIFTVAYNQCVEDCKDKKGDK